MAWATEYIAKLKNGETVQFRPHGNSMTGRINSGQLVTVEPIDDLTRIQVDEIVLCVVHGKQFLHIVKAKRGQYLQIGNNIGHVNGWTNIIHGRVIAIKD